MTAQAKAKALGNWRLLDVHRWSEYPEVNKAVDRLHGELKSPGLLSGSEKIEKRHIKVVVLDLYVAFTHDPQMYVGYYRANSEYKAKDNRYNKLHISKRTPSIIDALEGLGYLENTIGHYGRDGSRSSHMSRMRAKQKLIDLIEKKEKVKPKHIELAPGTEMVVLRDAEKNDIQYIDTPNTNCMRTVLRRYNNLLRRSFIRVVPKYDNTVKGSFIHYPDTIDYHDKFVRRIFNDSRWDKGGRFYGGWWQRIKREWRTQIRIGGHPSSVELDYSGLHIVMLYAMKGLDYWAVDSKDPYQLPDHTNTPALRQLLKLVLLIVLNSKDRSSALKAIQYEINLDTTDDYDWLKSDGHDLETYVDALADRHEQISNSFYTGIGKELQFIDSKIAETVIDHFIQKDIPILAIHDSFVVALDHEDELRTKMLDAFMMQMGKFEVKTKLDGLSRSKMNSLVDDDMKQLTENLAYLAEWNEVEMRRKHTEWIEDENFIEDYYK